MSGAVPDPLDRLAERAEAHANPESLCDLGDNGDPCLLCEENRQTARTVLALVEVAHAAREYLAYPTLAGRRQKLDAALARLERTP